MNPPLGTNDDRKALIDGIRDGTIDMIATDHAPHSAEEKSGGLAGSAFGIVGLETAFPVLYTELVMAGIIGLDRLCELMCVNPRKRFGIPFIKTITRCSISAVVIRYRAKNSFQWAEALLSRAGASAANA